MGDEHYIMVANGYAIGLLVTHKTSEVLWSTVSLGKHRSDDIMSLPGERGYPFTRLCKCKPHPLLGQRSLQICNANGNAHAQNRTRCATLRRVNSVRTRVKMPVAIVANAIWFLNYVLSLRGRRVNQMTDEGEEDVPASRAEEQDPCGGPDASEIDTETFVEKCSDAPERGILSLTSQDSTSSELESTPLAPDQELDGAGDASSKPTSTSSAIESEEEEPSSLNHLEETKATCTEMDTLTDVKNAKEEVKPQDTDETCTDREAVEEKLTCDVTEEVGMTALDSNNKSCADGEAGSTSTSSTIEEEEPSSQFHLKDSKSTCTAMDTSSADVAEMNERESPVEEEVKPLCDVTEEAKMNVVEDTEELSTDGEARST